MNIRARVYGLGSLSGTTNESARRAWVEAALAELPPGLRLLDAGAGECQYRVFCKHLDYVSQDFAEYTGAGEVGLQMGAWDNSRIDIVSDIVNIPVPDGTFDVVLCTEVLEHVVDPAAALRELARVLKVGGRLILTAPFRSLTHFAPHHYATGFSRYYYETVLPDLGLQVDRLEFNGNYFESLAQEARRVPDIAQRYTSGRFRLLDRLVAAVFIRALGRLAKNDRGSNELDAHGIHVIAIKSGS